VVIARGDAVLGLPMAAPGCHAQNMPFRTLLAVLVLVAGCTLACAAQDQGYWRAASTNANSITGDLAIGKDRLTINFTSFPLAPIRVLKTEEVAAAFDADVNAGGNGELYRVKVPAEKRFMHHNTLCGSEGAQWMATYVSGRNLQVAFFSGDTPPVLSMEALSNSMSLCGVFTYAR
jgi:hypothetical protein